MPRKNTTGSDATIEPKKARAQKATAPATRKASSSKSKPSAEPEAAPKKLAKAPRAGEPATKARSAKTSTAKAGEAKRPAAKKSAAKPARAASRQLDFEAAAVDEPAGRGGVVFRSRGRFALDAAGRESQAPAVAVAGRPFEVRYLRDVSDFGEHGELSRVDLCWRLGGGEIKVVPIADGERDPVGGALVRRPAVIDVPADARGTLEYWFKLNTVDGRVVWDSEFGRNHRARVLPQDGTTLVFDGAWKAYSDGAVCAGHEVKLRYGGERVLRLLDREAMMEEEPTVVAYASFDSRAPVLVELHSRVDGSFAGALTIPAGASTLALWFKAAAKDVVGWDSQLGRNYVFDVLAL